MLIADAGQAKLVYAPQFFSAAYESYGDGAILAIIAHEVGHALDDTLGAAWIKSNWTPELRADAWAACLLARINPSPEDLSGSLTGLAKYAPPTLPAWSQRLPAVRAGFTQCGGDGALFDREVGAHTSK
jgi:Zn-dependent protease with chaperone function